MILLQIAVFVNASALLMMTSSVFTASVEVLQMKFVILEFVIAEVPSSTSTNSPRVVLVAYVRDSKQSSAQPMRVSGHPVRKFSKSITSKTCLCGNYHQ